MTGVAQVEIGAIGQRWAHRDLARSGWHPAPQDGQRGRSLLRLDGHALHLLAVDHDLLEVQATDGVDSRDRQERRQVRLDRDVGREGPVPTRAGGGGHQRVEARSEGEHRDDPRRPCRRANERRPHGQDGGSDATVDRHRDAEVGRRRQSLPEQPAWGRSLLRYGITGCANAPSSDPQGAQCYDECEDAEQRQRTGREHPHVHVDPRMGFGAPGIADGHERRRRHCEEHG